MQRLKEVFYIGGQLGIFSRVSVFQGFHNNEQVQMRNTIAANFSKQSFKNFKKYWPCAVANPVRNQRVGSKLISWASGLNSFLGRNQVGFSKAAINLQSQIASQLNISQNNIYYSFFAEYEILIQIFVSLQGNNNKLLILLPKLVHILKIINVRAYNISEFLGIILVFILCGYVVPGKSEVSSFSPT